MKKIAIGTLLLTITAVAADITFPELRCTIGLENCSKQASSSTTQDGTSTTLKSAGLQPNTEALKSSAESSLSQANKINERDSQAEADIAFPKEGSKVDQHVIIKGWLEKSAQERSFLIIKPQEFEQFYPQGEIISDQKGNWQIKGTYSTPGYYYETFIVITQNPYSAKKLKKTRTRPLSRLPEETKIVSEIIVVERSTQTPADIEEVIDPEMEEYEEENEPKIDVEPEIEVYEEENEPEIEEEVEPKIEEKNKPEIQKEIDNKNAHAKADIIFPEDGAAVGKRVMINGKLENSRPEQRQFLIIKSQSFGKKLYPQGEIFLDETGHWTVKGIYYSPGYNYETFVVITNNPESAKQLEDQRNRAYGLKTLPEETQIISDIIVVKRQ